MKRFAQLSKKIKEIMELLNRGGGNTEDDAMFSKRHLGPNACASCEKDLVNMYGQAVDYHAWKKLPFRDPAERIARYGPGFSKILSHMRPSDLTGGYSPTRNVHHQSIDDTHLNYQHGHSNSIGGDEKHNTHGGSFFRGGGKTAPDRRNGSNNNRQNAYANHLSTHAGSSLDDNTAEQNYGGSPGKKVIHRPGGAQISAGTLPEVRGANQ